MDNTTEQRASIEFCFKIGKNAAETFELIKWVFKRVSLRRFVTFDRFERFKEVRISAEDDHSPGRPSTPKANDTITYVRNKIGNSRRLTAWKVANEVGV